MFYMGFIFFASIFVFINEMIGEYGWKIFLEKEVFKLPCDVSTLLCLIIADYGLLIWDDFWAEYFC